MLSMQPVTSPKLHGTAVELPPWFVDDRCADWQAALQESYDAWQARANAPYQIEVCVVNPADFCITLEGEHVCDLLVVQDPSAPEGFAVFGFVPRKPELSDVAGHLEDYRIDLM